MANSDDCLYLIGVKTTDAVDAGTTSMIGLKLESFDGQSITIENLKDHGQMDPGHTYFQRGNLDLFKVTKHCQNVCKITLTSDGTGNKPGWNVDFVEICADGSPKTNLHFPVKQSLVANKLSVTVDLCARALNPINRSSDRVS